MELQVSEIKALEPIKFNYEELKSSLTAKVETYKNLVYTEENIKEAKAGRALLNKLSKAINDEKIRVKNTLLAPFTDFETKCKELIDIVNKANENVDKQIKAYEQTVKDEKLKKIVDFFLENVGDYAELIVFDKIFNEKWLNVTYKMDQIEKDITHILTKTKTDMAVLDNTFKDESSNKAAKMEYFENIANPSVLTAAMLKGNKIIEDNKKLEELKQKQEVAQIPAKSEENVENSSQNLTSCLQNISDSEANQDLQQLDFRVWVTQRQKFALKEFLKANNIKFGRVE